MYEYESDEDFFERKDCERRKTAGIALLISIISTIIIVTILNFCLQKDINKQIAQQTTETEVTEYV